MEKSLLSITKYYAKEIRGFAILLDSISADILENKTLARHFILQIQHHAANARLELENLINEKE